MAGKYLAGAVQAAPIFLDLKSSIEKTIALIDQAGAQGVKLLAFPETWIPGYPFRPWFIPPVEAISFTRVLHENALSIDCRPHWKAPPPKLYHTAAHADREDDSAPDTRDQRPQLRKALRYEPRLDDPISSVFQSGPPIWDAREIL